MSSGDDPLSNRREEDEIQASKPADGEAGRTAPLAFINGHGKDAPYTAAQEEAETADKETESKGKGRGQSGKDLPGRLGPPESRARLETGVHVYRGPAGSRPRIVYVERGKTTEGSHNRSMSPRLRQAAYRPHGKATKRHSRPADPVTAPEEEVVLGVPAARKRRRPHRPKHPAHRQRGPVPPAIRNAAASRH